MIIKMNDKEMKLTLDGLIRILDAMKDKEFILTVPFVEAIPQILEGGEADAEETV